MRQATGDYGEQHQINHDLGMSTNFLATDAGPITLLTARDSSETIHVQRIKVSVTTYSAKTITCQDSAGTPVQVALFSIPAAAATNAGAQQFEVDFGPHGFSLTLGKNLTMTLSAAGVAAAVTVDAYSKREAGVYSHD